MCQQHHPIGKCYLQSPGRIRRYLGDATAVAAARALILSRLDFANSALAGIPARLMNSLQVVQNNDARLVTRIPSRAHITPVLQDLHRLPVGQRVFYKVICLTYGALNSTAPICLNDLVARRQLSRTFRSSADSSLLTVPRTRKEYGDRAFSAWGPRHWKSLPQGVRDSADCKNFYKGSQNTPFYSIYILPE